MQGRILKQTKTNPTQPNFPILGKVKVGELVLGNNGKMHPTSLDYFRITGGFASKVYEVYGMNPNMLEVTFDTDDILKVCNELLEARDNAGRLIGTGDGLVYDVYSVKEKRYVTITEQDSVQWEYIHKTYTWKPKLTMTFAIRGVSGVAGLWRLETHGVASSIENIKNSFDRTLAQAGTCAGLPFALMVKKHKSDSAEAKTYSVIDLVPLLSFEEQHHVRGILESGESPYTFIHSLTDGGLNQRQLAEVNHE